MRQKNVGGSKGEICERCDKTCEDVNLLDVIVHYASFVKKLDAGEQKPEPFTGL